MSSLPIAAEAPFWRRFRSALTGASVAWAVGWALTAALLLSPIFRPPLPVVFGRTL